jgi:carboxyl-terminal processing protease
MHKNTKIALPALLSLAVVAGIILGSQISRRTTSAFRVNPVNLYQSDKISLILRLIEKDYVDSIDKNQFIERVIPSLLSELDPHTTYIPASEMKEVNEEMRGNFGGIGVQFVMQNDTVMVVEVISGGPSQRIGIFAGDRIVSVDGNRVAGKNIPSDSIVSLLKGEKGTKVKVGIHRRGIDKPIDFEITRGEIPLYSVDVAFKITEQIGIVKVNRFAETTYDEFVNAIGKLKGEEAKKLIIDLRGNSGGYLQSVFRMADEFLGDQAMIVYTQGKNRAREEYHATSRGSWEEGDVVVLIDEYSASASEIFAGAIQDNDRGLVVGRRSFGKGLVQEQIPFIDGSVLRLTVSRFYTPSGRSIQKPYDNGKNDYYQDIRRRIENDELVEKDSIHMADTLQYFTLGGRKVHGGGGIMPDFFVPADTSGFSNFFANVISRNLIYSFALSYSDENRNVLNQFKTVSDLKEHLDEADVFQKLIQSIVQKGIKYSYTDLNESGKLIKNQLYAYISRNCMGEKGFYSVLYESDPTVIKAIELLKKEWDKEKVAQVN